MIFKGKRRQGIPYFISNDISKKLERVELSEKFMNENWFQKLIFENPQILPVDSIEIGFSPLISVGREISTDVGFIDNLFISPNGYLTIVEAKLWRNPEAKREVVGQIIDYAKELTTWSFERLNNAIKKRTGKQLLELIDDFQQISESEKSVLIDNIQRNLERGRFLLLIAGDGIRESVEEMIEYLSKSAQLQFTLGLVELQLFRNPNREDEYIVIPNLITRTREITRAVIRIENKNPNAKISVESDFQETDSPKKQLRGTITELDLLEQLEANTSLEIVTFVKNIIKNAISKNLEIDWNLGSFAIKFLDPSGSGIKISLLVVDRKGKIYLIQSGEQLKRLGYNQKIAYNYASETAKLFKNLSQHKTNLDTWNKYGKIQDLKAVYDQFEEQMDIYIESVTQENQAVASTRYN